MDIFPQIQSKSGKSTKECKRCYPFATFILFVTNTKLLQSYPDGQVQKVLVVTLRCDSTRSQVRQVLVPALHNFVWTEPTGSLGSMSSIASWVVDITWSLQSDVLVWVSCTNSSVCCHRSYRPCGSWTWIRLSTYPSGGSDEKRFVIQSFFLLTLM